MIVHAKICGINDANAMQAAVAAGAQYVGLVFYPPSPRALNPDQAAELGIHIPDEVTTVGLFVDPDDELVDDVLAKVSLGLLQLHGSENPARCQELRARTGLPVMKAIKVTDQ
ncbi:MAG: N-(5'-phosphoribosyl)anthranilate isomerase, partial [Alphaproteobacteria bacterium]|nr:N-(5'-phosphoribosyl)anthranilate isomerase [Alphaproteobacteria bacterium]